MKVKNIIVSILLCLLTTFLYVANYIGNKYIIKADNVYKIYLEGEVLGYISDDKKLYDLINERQQEIKEKFNVKNVYPPEGLSIINTNEYNVELLSAEDIYDLIDEKASFTIEGYIINATDSDGKTVLNINVLDRKVFEDAIHSFVLAFISQEEYDMYINNNQPEIEDTGQIIELMYFEESITIKKGYVHVNERIFNTSEELSQYLLFGENSKLSSYKVKAGDTISSIADSHKLNVEEFLIANTKYNSEDNLLTVGDMVNITLINPMIHFSYEVFDVSDKVIAYDKKINYNPQLAYTYQEITTAGVNGITRVSSQYKVINGEQQSGVIITDSKVIVEKVDQVVTKGSKYTGIHGEYVDDGTDWGWPTNQPYIITSRFAWRWGRMHNGVDISGTGYGSPIYAAYEGTVVGAGWGAVFEDGGCTVNIEHPNGYYTQYMHMRCKNDAKYCRGANTCAIFVSVGDHVTKGQVIGQMGSTGNSTGPHLHFALTYGYPYRAGFYYLNPCKLYNNKCV